MLAHQFGRLKAQLSSSVLNQVANVASCCCYPKISYTLNQTETCLDWLGYIARLKGTSKQVVMSAEGFSKTDAELGRLASDLSQLSTRIVMVYIPFYDWIASVYRGTHKETFSPTDFAHWLTDKTMEFWKNNRAGLIPLKGPARKGAGLEQIRVRFPSKISFQEEAAAKVAHASFFTRISKGKNNEQAWERVRETGLHQWLH